MSSNRCNIINEYTKVEHEEDSDSELGTTSSACLKEIVDILCNHNVVDSTNALVLNKEMQRRLSIARDKLQQLLEEIQQRVKANEQKLRQNLKRGYGGVGMRGAYLKGGTFYFKGNMFFKDRNCRNCPNNPDYVRRCTIGEMFPMDSELCGRHVWSLSDKTGIIEAIKEQVIVHLGDQYLKMRLCTGGKQKRECDVAICSEKLVNLLERVDGSFMIDWKQVSAHNLNHRHSASSCKAMWMMYLCPSLDRSKWTADLNNALLAAAKTHNFQNWDAIATIVGRRSAYQCFVQYQTEVCYMLPERWGKWTKFDDKRLLDMIDRYTKHGIIKWNAIAQYFPKKPKTSIVQRYTDYLHPRISHASFTAEEDLLLLTAVQEYGTKFSYFPRTLFPNRSVTQLRTRYRNTLQNRHKHTVWTLEDDEKLMEFIKINGTSSWLQCSEILENKHSRTSCRTRFLTILRHFKKNPKALLSDLPRKKTHYNDSVITMENWIEKVSELRENPGVELKKDHDKTMPQSGSSKKSLKITSAKSKSKKVSEQIKSYEPITKKPRMLHNVSQTPIKRCRRKAIYIERLRPIELQLYHYFKYAYNFHIGDDRRIHVPQSSYTTCQISNALGFSLLNNEQYLHGNNLPHSARQRCKTALQLANKKCLLETGYYLPPNWASIMSFRALCVHTTQVKSNPSSIDSKNEAVILFRMRLRSLLYQTTLLSRINIDSIEEVETRQFKILSLEEKPQHISKNIVTPMKCLHTQKEIEMKIGSYPYTQMEIVTSQQTEPSESCSKRKRHSIKRVDDNLKIKCDELKIDVKIEIES